jgi:tRNA A-37 threonylcarbamoyl transferase component Bud32
MLKKNDVILGKYRIKELLTSSGGMADIYVGENITLGYKVAVKQLKENLWKNDEIVDRLKIEAVAQSHVNHPGIVKVLDYDVDNLAIIMEFIDGRELKADPDRSLRKNLDYFIKTLEALSAAHALGVVHRDLKPSNVFITKDGYTKIADFGIAKILGEDNSQLTLLGVGTPSFMSPEQIEGKTITEASDIYSFGVVMYYVISGVLPFKEKTAQLTAMSQLQKRAKHFKEIGKEDVPPRLEDVIFKCLRKDPADRYPSAQELVVDLQSIYDEMRGVDEEELGFFTRTLRYVRRSAPVLAALVLLGIAAGVYLAQEKTGTLQVEAGRSLNIYVDGELQESIGPEGGSLKLPAGTHELVFEAPDFMKLSQSVRIENGEMTEVRPEFPDSGKLSIEGKAGETIFLNGKDHGTSPAKIEVTVGPYEVRLGDTTKQAIVLKGKTTNILF